MVALINASDPAVAASPAGLFGRVILKARVQGPDGNGITYGANAVGTSGSGAAETLTALSPALCCANVAYSPVTMDNPALPGEVVIVYATGLGLPVATRRYRGAGEDRSAVPVCSGLVTHSCPCSPTLWPVEAPPTCSRPP